MKKGITITQRFTLDNVESVDNLTDAIFTYKENEKEGSADTDFLLIKKLSSEDVTFEDGKFIIPLSQADTLKLTRIYYVEAQLIYNTGATNKWNIAKKSMRPTLRTEDVNGQSDGSEVEDLRMTIDDVFSTGGGTTSDYNELENKPKINDVTLSGNKTSANLGLASASDLDSKADKSTTYTKTETDNKLAEKQNTISGGNGIDVSSDVVSVDLKSSGSFLNFDLDTKGLYVESVGLGANSTFRTVLTNAEFNNPLASKQYVDNLISGRLKRLVVESLPTQDIDTNTIYMVLKSVPSTNNIYDEYMYINNAWELIGTTEVDLSNYYTKTESDNRYNPKLTVGNGIDITSDTISVALGSTFLMFANNGLTINTTVLGSSYSLRQELANGDSTTFALASKSNLADYQPKLTAGTNITIDSNNVISASGGGNPIIDTAKGSTISLTDSAESPLNAISIMGKSTQNGTPSIDTPIPIVDITTEEIEITNGTDTQQATLTKTLRGIPVSSGGNYTDNNNQQWVCDTIERYKDGSGKYIQRVNVLTFNGTENWRDDSSGTKLYLRVNIPSSNTNNPTTLFELSNDIKLTGAQVDNTDNSYYIQASFETTGSLYFSPTQNGTRLNASQFKTYLESNNAKLYHPIQTPIETPLTAEELAELNLDTYYPSTTISANADVVVEYVVDVETALSVKQDKTTITTDTSNTSITLTLADNNEYRYTQELSALTLTLPLSIDDDFISSVVFKSGTIATQMTYDSSIKWSGTDVTSNAFVPQANQEYEIVFWYNGLSINAVVRGVA